MTNDSNAKKKNKQTVEDQEEILKDQYEFGLNEEVREKLEEEDAHKESDDIADEDDIIVEDD